MVVYGNAINMYVARDGFGVRANPFIISEIGMKRDMFYVKSRCKKIREFGTRHSRYTNYRVSLTGEIATFLLVDSCLKGMVFYPTLDN